MTGSLALTIRAAAPGDAEAIADIYNQSVLRSTATFDTEPKTAAERLEWLSGHDERHPVIVAEVEGRVVGWGSLSAVSDRPAWDLTVETGLYVGVDARDRGVGSSLMAELLRLAEAAGHHVVIARIVSENAASLALAHRAGFTDAGVMHEVGRKFGRWLDVVVLEKPLPTGSPVD